MHICNSGPDRAMLVNKYLDPDKCRFHFEIWPNNIFVAYHNQCNSFAFCTNPCKCPVIDDHDDKSAFHLKNISGRLTTTKKS